MKVSIFDDFGLKMPIHTQNWSFAKLGFLDDLNP